jgi:glycosyltransferase involved in cell wall biosynthesis
MALFRLLERLDRREFQPLVACYYNGDGRIAQKICSLGITVVDLGMSSKWRIEALIRLYRLFVDERPTILHSWMFHANLPGRLLGRLAKIPIIISSEHTLGQEGHLRIWLNRLTAPLADRVICVSHSIASYAHETIHVNPNKLTVIPNGVDETSFQNLPPKTQARLAFHLPANCTVIGAIGRPRPVKGYSYLLQGFASLAERHPKTHLLFVGEGPGRRDLIQQANSQNLSGRVTFLDDQEDIPSLLAALDIVSIPSLSEGMPVVALEAMAAGLPVVATHVGGTPEVVEDGATGLLVPPARPEALAEALEQLLVNPALREKMGRAGQARVSSKFSITRNVGLTQDLYRALLSGVG